jgi:hypothetical protein
LGIQLELPDDVALVLFELLASEKLEENVEAPERNALWILEGILEKRLTVLFSPNYLNLLEKARSSLVDRYGA